MQLKFFLFLYYSWHCRIRQCQVLCLLWSGWTCLVWSYTHDDCPSGFSEVPHSDQPRQIQVCFWWIQGNKLSCKFCAKTVKLIEFIIRSLLPKKALEDWARDGHQLPSVTQHRYTTYFCNWNCAISSNYKISNNDYFCIDDRVSASLVSMRPSKSSTETLSEKRMHLCTGPLCIWLPLLQPSSSLTLHWAQWKQSKCVSKPCQVSPLLWERVLPWLCSKFNQTTCWYIVILLTFIVS